MHQQVRPGDTLTVSTPNNLFAIEPQARKHLLIAGGIGITPFLSHIPELEQRQADWQLHYCFHDADNNAFVDALSAAPWRDRVNVHVSALGSRLDLPRLFADLEPGTHVYTCGPAALNEAVKAPPNAIRCPPVSCTLSSLSLRIKAERRLPWCWRVPDANLPYRRT